MTPDMSREIAELLNTKLAQAVCPHYLMGQGVLHDRGIAQAIQNGTIKIPQTIDPVQLQSNSLDVRIDTVFLHDNEFTEITRGENHPIYIPPYMRARIYLREEISREFMMYPVLRSGKGRIGLRPTNEGVLAYEYGAYIEVDNTTESPIGIYRGDRFAQLLFYGTPPDGYVVRNAKEAKASAQRMSPLLETVHGYTIFRVGSWIAELKDNIKVINSRTSTFEELFSKKESQPFYDLQRGKHYIVQLTPKIQVPNDLSLLILPFIPINGEAMFPLGTTTCNAGFVDSGYCRDTPGNITGHIMPQEDIRIYPNQIMALGLIHKFFSEVQRPYGSTELQSSHTSSDGATLSVKK